MVDQAAELRQRMNSLAERAPAASTRPRVLVLCGAMPGVGASSTAVNLAAELGRHGRRVVIVDSQMDGRAKRLCGVPEMKGVDCAGLNGASLADVYRGRCSLSAAIARGSHVLRVIGNSIGTLGGTLSPTDDEVGTLADEIPKLGNEADLVLVDAGPGDSVVARTLAMRADLVLVVTTAADASVMEAYASIKRMTAAGAGCEVAVAVSRAGHFADAENTFSRLQQGCQRFLGRTVVWAGTVLEDSTVADADMCAAPFVVLSPRCDAARGIRQVAEYLEGAVFRVGERERSSESAMDERRDVEQMLAAIGEVA
jgi:flagellar biosynthesis protein FlhG